MSATPPDPNANVKIYITLQRRWVDVLEILARDPSQKSNEFLFILREYIHANKERLKQEGLWEKIQEALRSGSDVPEIDMVTFIDEYVKQQPNNMDLQKYWLAIKAGNNKTKIKLLYDRIQQKINEIEKNLDAIL
jgi:hypothetical protein